MRIIIAHYNENLDWINLIKKEYDAFIYSKTLKQYNFLGHNKGQEATCYLQYIIDNYSKRIFEHIWHYIFTKKILKKRRDKFLC